MNNEPECWSEAAKGSAWEKVSENCNHIESKQSELFRKFKRLVAMHNPRSIDAPGPHRRQRSIPSYNLVAINVDSVHANLAAQLVRSRIVTEGAEWSIQRQARQLQRYADSLNKRLRITKHAKRTVWTSALKSLGLTKVCATNAGKVKVEAIQPDSIFVDDDEVENCETRRLHHAFTLDAAELCAEYPKHKNAIKDAKGKRLLTQRFTGEGRRGQGRMSPNKVCVIESWSLPAGVKGKPGYQKGRHTVCIDGRDLLDEDYHESFFPFALFRWGEGDGSSFYGFGGAERCVPHQGKLAKLDFLNDRQIENGARPVTYTTIANMALLGQRKVSATGQYIPTTDGQAPKTVTGPSIAPEQMNYRAQVKAEGIEAFGNSRQLIDGSVPNQLESGVAVREARQTATGPWALQEQDYEQLCIDIMWLVLHACKTLGKNAPVVTHTTFKGSRKKLDWAAVNMDLVRDQMEPASAIARTPAAKASLATELGQAGVISHDEMRRMIENPDIGRAMSIWTAEIESLERQIEEILDGEVLMPTSYTNHKLAIWRFTAAIKAAENDGAPEDAIERLRNYLLFCIGNLEDQEAKQLAAQQPAQLPAGPEEAQALDPAAPIPPEALPIAAG